MGNSKEEAPVYDYGEDAAGEKPTDAVFEKLWAFVNEQAEAEREVKKLTADLARANERLKDIRERRLPAYMLELGLPEFKHTSGLHIMLKREVHASLPKDPERKAVGIKWLDDNGHGSIVKRQIVVDFDREHEKWALKVERNLRRYKEPLEIAVERNVHGGTLKSFIKNMIKEGRAVPMELFQAYEQTIAVIG